MSRADEERFFGKCERPPTGCWTWTGAHDRHGYGKFWYRGETRLAHRAAYEMFVGPIPDGLTIDHVCRNRECVNFDHLEVATHAENNLRGDGWSGLNSRKTHCIHGHEYTAENTIVRSNGQRPCKHEYDRRRDQRDRLALGALGRNLRRATHVQN